MIVDHNKLQSDTWVSRGERPRRPGGEGRGLRLGGRRAATGNDVARARARRSPSSRERARAARSCSIADTRQGRRRLLHGAARPAASTRRRSTTSTPARPTAEEYERALAEISTRGSTGGSARSARPRSSWSRPEPPRARAAPRARRSGSSPPTARRSSSRPSASRASSRSTPTCARHRPGRVPRALPRPLLRVRHRRAGHGLAGRRDGARRPAAGRALLRLLPLDAPERADLQQRHRGHEGHLRRLARRDSSPAGPGHSHQSVRDISALGAMPGHGADRAVLASTRPRGGRLGGAARPRARLHPPRQRAVGARLRAAAAERARRRARGRSLREGERRRSSSRRGR